jgi:hypothetical protein
MFVQVLIHLQILIFIFSVSIVEIILFISQSLFSLELFLLKSKFVAIKDSIDIIVITIIISAKVNHFLKFFII